jgi:tricorn protease
MIRRRAALVFVLLTCLTTVVRSQTARPYFSDPAISPDRSEIAFVSGGDIWAVAAAGGEARLLVSHPATESRPMYSPDARRLAFVSNRTGGGDIYTLAFATGDLKRLTFDDGNEQLDGWSRDGQWIYFSSASRDISGMNDVHRISSEGGTAMEVAADRYTNEYFSSVSPDGSSLAITARANASGQWWRNGNSHLDQAEVWIVRDGTPPKYEAVTSGGAKELWPMWSADGRTLYYVSDRGGAQNLWSKAVAVPNSTPRQLTEFREGRVLWPSISADGRLIVFEHDFEVWKLDTSSNQTSRVAITRRGAPAGASVEHLALTDNVSELALSPDGKKVAFVVRGEVFAASAKDGGDAARISRSVEFESQVVWSNDSRKLVYASDRDKIGQLYVYDFAGETESALTSGAEVSHSHKLSPDGKLLAFIRGSNEIRVIDMSSKQERLLGRGAFDRPPFAATPPFAWSPDNKWLAYLTIGENGFTNAHVASADGSTNRPVSFVANSYSNTISWSPDGKFIIFDTGQRTEARQIARIDLVPRTPQFREDQFRDLFREEPVRPAPPAPVPPPPPPAEPVAADITAKPTGTQIVFEDIRKRISLLPTGVDAGSQVISPDGKTLLLNARAAGQQNLYTFSIDELSREPAVARQLTSTPGGKSFVQFTPDGKEVFYLEQGRITAINVDSRQSRRIAVTAEMDVDFATEKMQVFNQAWSYMRDNFYDPQFHGTNWQNVRSRYEPLVAGAATRDEMRRLLALMVGELNASHLGVNAPAGGAAQVVGKLGLRFDRREYEQSGRLRVTEVILLGPAAIAGVKAGEYVVQVDGTNVSARTNLDELLNHKINRRVELIVASDGAGANRREVVMRPVNQTTEKNLLYRQWVEANRDYVAKASNGRLGYVHMFDMSENSLNQLYLDLDVENQSRQAVVVDVRNNNGGFVNMYALDVFSRQNYLTMTPRGFPAASGRSLLGQRALGKPTILVTNQHSLSDAEDFTEGYRSLKLGKVVGEPTSGWIIYTSNMPLIDGTVLRIPFVKVQGSDGKVMEMAPRPVDIPVKRPVGESYSGRDAQLDTAVDELLRQLTRK